MTTRGTPRSTVPPHRRGTAEHPAPARNTERNAAPPPLWRDVEHGGGTPRNTEAEQRNTATLERSTVPGPCSAILTSRDVAGIAWLEARIRALIVYLRRARKRRARGPLSPAEVEVLGALIDTETAIRRLRATIEEPTL